MGFTTLVPWLYMGLFMIIGWRLYTLGWPIALKALAAAALTVAPPLLFLLSAMRNLGSGSASVVQATAFSMFLMGALCLAGGVAATWLREWARRNR